VAKEEAIIWQNNEANDFRPFLALSLKRQCSCGWK